MTSGRKEDLSSTGGAARQLPHITIHRHCRHPVKLEASYSRLLASSESSDRTPRSSVT